MIVRINTSKGLSWTGRVVVFGMAALVLPPAPSWARNNRSMSTEPDRMINTVDTQPSAEKKHNELLTQLTKDDKKKDDNTGKKASEAVDRLQDKVKELVDKLGKELSPVAEEVRKTLEKAVGDIHKSLEKEGLSPEDLSNALDNAQKDLRKAFEGGGAVDKEVREAIEKARKDLQETLDRARGDLQNQVDALRPGPRESKDQAPPLRSRQAPLSRSERFRDVEKELNHDDLESTRREISSLEQRLRAATRRLEKLEQQKSKPNPRSDGKSHQQPQSGNAPSQGVTPATPSPGRAQRGRGLGLPGGGAMRHGPQMETDRRFRELEDKIKALLKEVESLKGEKSSRESKDPSSSNTPSVKQPTSPAAA